MHRQKTNHGLSTNGSDSGMVISSWVCSTVAHLKLNLGPITENMHFFDMPYAPEPELSLSLKVLLCLSLKFQ